MIEKEDQMNQLYRKMRIVIFISAIGIAFFSGGEGRTGNHAKAQSHSQHSGSSSPVAGSMPDSVAGESEGVDDTKVTFIELGSVRCIPCRKMQPIMAEIEKEYAGQVNVVFHDVWTEKGRPYAQKYRIKAIPTQIFLDSEGNEYFRHEGFFPKDELVAVLKKQGVEEGEKK